MPTILSKNERGGRTIRYVPSKSKKVVAIIKGGTREEQKEKAAQVSQEVKKTGTSKQKNIQLSQITDKQAQQVGKDLIAQGKTKEEVSQTVAGLRSGNVVLQDGAYIRKQNGSFETIGFTAQALARRERIKKGQATARDVLGGTSGPTDINYKQAQRAVQNYNSAQRNIKTLSSQNQTRKQNPLLGNQTGLILSSVSQKSEQIPIKAQPKAEFSSFTQGLAQASLNLQTKAENAEFRRQSLARDRKDVFLTASEGAQDLFFIQPNKKKFTLALSTNLAERGYRGYLGRIQEGKSALLNLFKGKDPFSQGRAKELKEESFSLSGSLGKTAVNIGVFSSAGVESLNNKSKSSQFKQFSSKGVEDLKQVFNPKTPSGAANLLTAVGSAASGAALGASLSFRNKLPTRVNKPKSIAISQRESVIAKGADTPNFSLLPKVTTSVTKFELQPKSFVNRAFGKTKVTIRKTKNALTTRQQRGDFDVFTVTRGGTTTTTIFKKGKVVKSFEDVQPFSGLSKSAKIFSTLEASAQKTKVKKDTVTQFKSLQQKGNFFIDGFDAETNVKEIAFTKSTISPLQTIAGERTFLQEVTNTKKTNTATDFLPKSFSQKEQRLGISTQEKGELNLFTSRNEPLESIDIKLSNTGFETSAKLPQSITVSDVETNALFISERNTVLNRRSKVDTFLSQRIGKKANIGVSKLENQPVVKSTVSRLKKTSSPITLDITIPVIKNTVSSSRNLSFAFGFTPRKKIKTNVKQRTNVETEQIFKPSQDITIKQQVSQIPKQEVSQIFKTSSKTITKKEQKVQAITTLNPLNPTVSNSFFKIPIIRPKIKLPSFGGSSSAKTGKRKRKSRTKYTPTLTASALNLKSISERKTKLTGLELRGI